MRIMKEGRREAARAEVKENQSVHDREGERERGESEKEEERVRGREREGWNLTTRQETYTRTVTINELPRVNFLTNQIKSIFSCSLQHDRKEI